MVTNVCCFLSALVHPLEQWNLITVGISNWSLVGMRLGDI